MKTIKLLALFFVSSLVFVSCSSDDDNDDHDHEEELITTVTYTLTNGNDVITLEFEDLDGEGGADGTTTVSGNLSANTTYTGSIKLLNETEDPAEDITEEVEEEGDEHEFFYSSTISDITITKEDEDEDGNPIGIETTLTTGEAGSGSLTIILKHEPTKPNDGTSTGAGGSTDVEVTFSIEVE
ncbi:type 1 periplasmic binding fold superfamily protein [Seonamhaeicola sp. NFXS20]|uniref:type 1 periplasmic binding fold superfamily protein n=1 Tax=Seonamhaeicola sp. NFXS20 TaxID=2816959 RepID=UPI003B8C882A